MLIEPCLDSLGSHFSQSRMVLASLSSINFCWRLSTGIMRKSHMWIRIDFRPPISKIMCTPCA